MNNVSEFTRVIRWQITGVNATAFGLGLNDVALTLSLLAAAAAASAFADSAFLAGCALEPDPDGFVVACVVLLDGCAAGCDFLPLKGGIA
jgi:hypothetical protein